MDNETLDAVEARRIFETALALENIRATCPAAGHGVLYRA